MFSGGTDTGDIRCLPFEPLQALNTLLRERTPQGFGGFDLHAFRRNNQIDGLRGATGDNQGVESRSFKCAGVTATISRVEEKSGEWRFGSHADAAVPRNIRIRDRSDREHHAILRRKCIHTGLKPIIQQSGGKPIAPEIEMRELLTEGIDTTDPGRQINRQDASAIAVHKVLRRRSISRTTRVSPAASGTTIMPRRDLSWSEVYSQ